jgi:leucyl aminopeptidase
MQVRVLRDAPAKVRAGAIVVPLFSDTRLGGAAAAVDAAIGGALADAIATGETKGKLYETTLFHAKDRPFHRVLAVGLGKREEFAPYLLSRWAGAAVRSLGRKGVEEIAIALPDDASRDAKSCVSAIAEGAIAGGFEITIYQEQPEQSVSVKTIAVLCGDLDATATDDGLRRGVVLGESVNLARRLAVTPANDMTPTILAEEATKAAKEVGVAIDVHDADWARKQGMGSFLSVASGSAEPPKFIVLTYKGDPSSNELLALVGKGITFDTGGISIKPAEKMEDMKYDMSGGAAVIAAMRIVGTLKPRINVTGIVPATENMPGGRATKPGDIVRAMNGKSIEIINTDAEGRLILADALCYANKLGATRICDTATLTGAVSIALGSAFAAVISNNDEFCEKFFAAAKSTGERFWRLPSDGEYLNQMKSDIADLKNAGGRAAGTCTAAAFLKEFVGDTPWIHLDIAATAYRDSGTAWSAKGPTGIPVRSFLALIEGLSVAKI